MSHIYTLSGVLNGKNIKFKRLFSSRNAAIDYMFKYYEDHYFYNFQVEEEIIKSKHDIEYVYNYDNRFEVARLF